MQTGCLKTKCTKPFFLFFFLFAQFQDGRKNDNHADYKMHSIEMIWINKIHGLFDKIPEIKTSFISEKSHSPSNQSIHLWGKKKRSTFWARQLLP